MEVKSTPAGESPYRLIFYKEDIQQLEAAMQGVVSTNGLEGCMLVDAWGHLITFNGKFPIPFLELIADHVRTGTEKAAVNVGSGAFIVGLQSGKPALATGAHLETICKLLATLGRTSWLA